MPVPVRPLLQAHLSSMALQRRLLKADQVQQLTLGNQVQQLWHIALTLILISVIMRMLVQTAALTLALMLTD